MLSFPHPWAKNVKRCHRLVILPDYQGIGLGVRFISCVADLFAQSGFRFSIITSARNFCCALAKSPDWVAYSFQASKKSNVAKVSPKTKSILQAERRSCKMASFYWRPAEK